MFIKIQIQLVSKKHCYNRDTKFGYTNPYQ
jgi:hypothetical protein